MSSIDNKVVSSPDTFIQDIHCILTDIKHTQKIKCNEIQEHFKNIASNPANTYTHKEQIAILIEIMNCYNKNIKEYQKNMLELSSITKTLIKTYENNTPPLRKSRGNVLLFDNCISSQDHEDVPPRDDPPNQSSLLSLYDYFMQFIWGTKTIPEPVVGNTAISHDREPAVNFSDIFQDTEANIQYTNSVISQDNTVNDTHVVLANTCVPIIATNKKHSKRRNTIQPIIKHIPHM